jgi:hypothetical protein
LYIFFVKYVFMVCFTYKTGNPIQIQNFKPIKKEKVL